MLFNSKCVVRIHNRFISAGILISYLMLSRIPRLLFFPQCNVMLSFFFSSFDNAVSQWTAAICIITPQKHLQHYKDYIFAPIVLTAFYFCLNTLWNWVFIKPKQCLSLSTNINFTFCCTHSPSVCMLTGSLTF